MGWIDNIKDWFNNITEINFLVPESILSFIDLLKIIFYVTLDVFILIFIIAYILFFFVLQYYIIKFYIWLIKNIISQIPIIKDFIIIKIINNIDTDYYKKDKETKETKDIYN